MKSADFAKSTKDFLVARGWEVQPETFGTWFVKDGEEYSMAHALYRELRIDWLTNEGNLIEFQEKMHTQYERKANAELSD